MPGRSRHAFLAAAVAAIVLTLPASAHAIGADLNRPANVTYGCEALPSTDPFGLRFLLPSNTTQGILGLGQQITSCTYLAVGSIQSQAEIIQAPGPGVFTIARVKAGPVVGPMQIVVLRAIRGGVPQRPGQPAGPGIACCIFRRASAPFVPAPNSVTAIAVNLPVNVNVLPDDPEVGESIDYLGLTVLAPGVPIPAHDIGTPGDITQPGALAWFPGVGPQQPERADGAGVGAFQPLLNADFVPCPLAAGTRRARAAQAGPCSAIPTGAAGAVPTPPAGAAPDVIAPTITRLRRARRRVLVAVSEPSTVTLALARCRRTRCRTVRTLTGRAEQPGTVAFRVPRRLAGRLRATATATDAAGNASAPVQRRVTIPRP